MGANAHGRSLSGAKIGVESLGGGTLGVHPEYVLPLGEAPGVA